MKNKTRIKIIKAITAIMAIVFVLSICAADSNPLLSLVTLLVSGTWLYLVAYANGWVIDTKPFYKRLEREENDLL